MLRSATVCVAGSTTQTAGRPFASVSAVAGTSMTSAEVADGPPDNGRAEAHGGGRVGQPDLHLKGAGDRVGLRRDFPHPSGGLDAWDRLPTRW